MKRSFISWRFAMICMAFAFAVFSVAIFLGNARLQIESERERVANRLELGLDDEARAVIGKISEWRERLLADSIKTADNDSIRDFLLYARDMDNPLMHELAPQAEKALRGFISKWDIFGLALVSRSGKKLMGKGTDLVSQDLVEDSFAARKTVFGKIADFGGVWQIPAVTPVFDGKSDRGMAGAICFLLPAAPFFAEAIGDDSIEISFTDADKHAMTAYVDKSDHELRIGAAGKAGVPASGSFLLVPSQTLGGDLGYVKSVFSAEPDVVISAVSPESRIASLLKEKSKSIWIFYMGLGGAIALAAILCAALIATWSSKSENAKLRGLYNNAAKRKTMLDGMSESVGAAIVMADRRGRILMNNRNFAELAKRASFNENEPLSSVFSDIKPVLLAMSECASDGGRRQLEWKHDGNLYRVSISPFKTSDDEGTVAVFSDITKFRRKAELEKKRMVSIIDAFARAIERVEPGSLGQSARTRELALAVSGDLSDDDRLTLDFASKLSQVGKLYVPREIFGKGELDEKDRAELAKIPEHAAGILSDLMLDLPVAETVAKMGSRFDENPYLPIHARVLTVCNAVSAMGRKRAFRDKMSFDEIINVISCDPMFDMNMAARVARAGWVENEQ